MKIWHFVVIVLILLIGFDLLFNNGHVTRSIQQGFARTVGGLVN